MAALATRPGPGGSMQRDVTGRALTASRKMIRTGSGCASWLTTSSSPSAVAAVSSSAVTLEPGLQPGDGARGGERLGDEPAQPHVIGRSAPADGPFRRIRGAQLRLASSGG